MDKQTRSFFRDGREFIGDDLFYFEDDDVTELGIGEAARRIEVKNNAATWSPISILTSRFVGDELNVIQGLREDPVAQIQVPNHTDITRLVEKLVDLFPVPKKWTELLEVCRRRFDLLHIGPNCDKTIAHFPYVPAAGHRIISLLGILQQIMAATNQSGFVLGRMVLAGNPDDGQPLKRALDQARCLTGQSIEEVFVDRGDRSLEGEASVCLSGQRRGIVTRRLKKCLRRQAIEVVIGHLKSDGHLGRNWRQGRERDRVNALLSGAGHHWRLTLPRLRFLSLDSGSGWPCLRRPESPGTSGNVRERRDNGKYWDRAGRCSIIVSCDLLKQIFRVD